MPRVLRLLPAILTALLAGCRENGGGGPSSDWEPPLERAPQAAQEEPSDRFVTVRGLRDQMNDAVAAPPRAEESLGRDWRVSFDGERKGLGLLPDKGTVYAGPGAPSSARRQRVRMQEPRRPALRVEEPPSPDVPRADLPRADGDDGPKGAGPTMKAFAAFQQKLYQTLSPLVSRLGWNARAPKASPVRHNPFHVTVHHTEGLQTMTVDEGRAAVRNIQHYHMYGRAKEGKEAFSDVGYHFLIGGDGAIFEGRHAEHLGSHAGGSNDGNIGIALMGNFNKHQPTKAQLDSLRHLVAFLAIKYKKDPGQKGFLNGHNHYTHTDCPGKNLRAMLDALRIEIDAEATRTADTLSTQKNSADAGSFRPVVAYRPTGS